MSNSPPKLWLRPIATAEEGVVAPWLARAMGLDVWGRNLLTRSAVRGLRTLATALLTVFAFQFFAWSLLFNALLNGSTLAFGWRTFPATVLGFLIALALVLLERSILTADVSIRGWRSLAAVATRLLLVTLSALATAQPLEALVFRREIQARLQDEELRRHAVLVASLADSGADQQQSEARLAWLERIRAAPPGVPVADPPASLPLFDPYEAGFFREMQVIDDLRSGRPPEWPAANPVDKARASALLGLDQVAEDMERDQARARADFVNRIWYLSLAVACFVPAISVLAKLVLGPEMRAYYSLQAQASSGSLEAQRVVEALEVIEK